MEKVDDVWTPKLRLKVSSGFLTDSLGFSGLKLGLAIDPSPPASSDPFNGPPVAVTEKLEGIKPFYELEISKDPGICVMLANPEGSEKPGPYQVFFMNTNRKSYGAGRILVQNFSLSQIAAVLGGKAVDLPPGKTEIVELGADQLGDMAQITLQSKESEGLHVFYDTRWPVKTDYRRSLLIHPKEDGSLLPYLIPEYPPFR